MKVLWVRPVAELEQRERALAGLSNLFINRKVFINDKHD
jgi:hypothetical protein